MRIYGLQDLPSGETDESRIQMLAGRSLILVVKGRDDSRVARIVLWEDDVGLRAAYLDIDARPLERRVEPPIGIPRTDEGFS